MAPALASWPWRWSWPPRRRTPLVLQSRPADCGVACLVMVARAHGRPVDAEALRGQVAGELARGGVDVVTLIRLGAGLGLIGRGLQVTPADLHRLRLPAIAHWRGHHFVVLSRRRRGGCVVHDPAVGRRDYPWAELAHQMSGVVVEWSAQQETSAPTEPRSTLRYRDLLARVPRWPIWAAAVLLTGLLMQGATLLNPLLLQWALDQGLSADPRQWVAVMGTFLALVVIRAGVGYWRTDLLLRLSSRLGQDLTRLSVGHLLSLPLAWFEARSPGLVLARLGAIDGLRRLLAQDLLIFSADLVFTGLAFGLLLRLSPPLATVSGGLLLLFIILRASGLGPERAHRTALLNREAAHRVQVMETVHSTLTLRLHGLTESRASLWLEGQEALTNDGLRLDRFQARTAVAQQILLGLDQGLTLLLGAVLVQTGSLSVGRWMAFLLLKQYFVQAAAGLAPRALELGLIGIQRDRLADVLDAESEGPDWRERRVGATAPALTVSQLRFRYPGSPSPILNGVDLQVAAGEQVWIRGASGSGKSTLLKLVLGLYRPEAGNVAVGGTEEEAGCHGAGVNGVLPADRLLQGSLAFNVTLGRPEPEPSWRDRVASLSGLGRVLPSLPGGWDFHITGDDALSAGQRQRVLLARALYARPRLLLLDEALTHLESDAAVEILKALRARKLAVVLTGHLEGLAPWVDRHLTLAEGVLR